MGIIKKQGIIGSIAIYIGILIGAFNSIYLFPKVFIDSPEAMGLVQLLLAYSIVVGSFVGAGFPSGIVYFFPKFLEEKRKALFGFTLLISAVILVGVFLVINFNPDFVAKNITEDPNYTRPYLYQLFVLIAFYVVFEVLTAVMQSFRVVVFPNVLKDVGRKIVISLLLFATYFRIIESLTEFINWLVVLYGVLLIALAIEYLRKIKMSFSFDFKSLEMKEILMYCLTVFLSSAVFIFISHVDVIMLGRLAETTKEVALYSIAYQIGSVVGTPARALTRALIPLFAEHFSKNEIGKLIDIYKQAALNQFLVSSFVFLVIAVNLNLINSFLPTDYLFGKGVVYVIGLGFLFSSFVGPNGAAMVVSKYFRYDSFLNLGLLVMVIVLNYIFIPVYGVFGAAATTAIVTIANNLAKSIILKKKYNIPYTFYRLNLLALLLVLLFAVQLLLPESHVFIWSGIATFLVTIIYCGIILFTNIAPDLKSAFLFILKARSNRN